MEKPIDTYRAAESLPSMREYEADTNMPGLTVRGPAASEAEFRSHCSSGLNARVVWIVGSVREV